MNTQLQQIFDSVPEDQPRSRLEPYRELILRWKRQGRSYRRIRELVAENCHVEVTTPMIHKFIKTRSRPRKEEPEREITPAELEPLVVKSKPTHEERVAKREAIRAAFIKPTLEEKPAYRFEFDEGQPITNKHHLGVKNGNSTTNG